MPRDKITSVGHSASPPGYAALQQSMSADPLNPRLHFELGSMALATQNWSLAAESFRKVTQLAEHVEAGFFNLGNALFELEDYEDAAAAYSRAFELDPSRGTLNNLGNAYAAAHQHRLALSTYLRALDMPTEDPTGKNSDTISLLKNLGTTATDLGELEQAREWLQRAHQLDPSNFKMTERFVNSCLWSNRLHDALVTAQNALAQSIDSPDLHLLVSDCHAHVGDMAQALVHLVKAIGLRPDDPTTLACMGEHFFRRGRFTESKFCTHRALSLLPTKAQIHSQWLKVLLHEAQTTDAAFSAEARHWARTHANVGATPTAMHSLPAASHTEVLNTSATARSPEAASPPVNQSRPLNIGLLSNAFHRGPVERWLSPLLQNCDRSIATFTAYADQVGGDQRTEQLRTMVDRWRTVTHRDDSALSQLIRADQIDVLIDFIGHSAHNRFPVFMMRSAPVQIAWAGTLATTGLQEMDWILADSNLLPLVSESCVSEKPLRLPNSFYCLAPPPKPPESSSRSAEQLESITFGSICSLDELSEDTLAAWAKILLAVPSARLLLVDSLYASDAVRTDVQGWFRARTVEPTRIAFLTLGDSHSELDALQEIDIALDPFPINAPTSALAALWMGIAVVCSRGQRMSSRATAGLLDLLNRNDWIASSSDEYVALATRLAQNPAGLTAIRATVRAELEASPLYDAKAFAKRFEVAIHHAHSQRMHA